METLFAKHDRYIRLTSTKLVRGLINDINWNARLICLQGPRGVGKSTLLKQYIKLNYKATSREVLYCSLDSVYFANHTLLGMAEQFVALGGRRLFLDEVHKYDTWSKEIKEIYDLYPELQIVFSGSSLLHLLNADADLSRRCVRYNMQGLSFREFLLFYKGISVPKYSLEEVLSQPNAVADQVLAACSPIKEFKEYLKFGYYPFYLDNHQDYYTMIEQVLMYIIEVELPLLCGVEVANTRKLKALIEFIANSVPYQIDATKLGNAIGVHRTTAVEYLLHLGRAKLLNPLYSNAKNLSKTSRPDKVYLENTNLMYAITHQPIQVGTLRETFAVNQLSYNHTVTYGRAVGDFYVDGRFLFEVGGKEKSFKQIADMPDSYVLADDIEPPFGAKLPLWMMGLLY